MDNRKQALICANPDLNYIDGSSIWAQTIALVLAETGQLHVDFLARSTPQRDELFRPLYVHPNITIIDGSREQGLSVTLGLRLSQQAMADLAVQLDTQNSYDLILVRGLEIAESLLSYPELLRKTWLYLTDIPQRIDAFDNQALERVRALAHGCHHLLCQSEGFFTLWRNLVPDLPNGKLILYPPVIPDLPEQVDPISERCLSVVYAGKFKAEWKTLEMAETWPEVHRRHPDATLRMIGDKIHTEANAPNFEPRMRKALKSTRGLEWIGAITREAVQRELLQARVGLSWRSECMDETLEYSTKILEYGGAGCAAILNRNPLHESLLGKDYPLYANNKQEYLRALEIALTDDVVTQNAADCLMLVAQRHTFSSRVEDAKGWLTALPKRQASQTVSKRKLRVLVAGHDLKFFAPLQKKLEETGKFEFLVDKWHGHDHHDEEKSRSLLPRADVIFCEWCLGNLKWYSRHRLPHQRLVARFHLQERELPYVAEADWDRIDHISYVSEFIRKESQRVFGFPEERTSVIGNYLDPDRFSQRKKTGDARFTLGMVGAAPSRKRLDRAIDLLERLLEQDARYCLRVKGRHPLDYGWLLQRDDEVAYYRKVFERINRCERLSRRVIFDPPGNDVNDWFSMVGYVLSPSEFESFHMAVGEGILTGSQPIVWAWEGASAIWGSEYIVHNLQDAESVVLSGIPNTPPELPEHLTPELVIQAWTNQIAR